MGYVRGSFWVRVRPEVEGKRLFLPGLNERAGEWVAQVANVRVHGTHGEVVLVRYAREEALLGKVDGRPRFDTSYHDRRRVGRDGRLSYRGRLYQVALKYALSEVDVAENLDKGVTIRGREGEVVRWGLVPAGGVVAREVVYPASRDRREEEAGAEVLQAMRSEGPEVERRDLGVYEEVARAASTR